MSKLIPLGANIVVKPLDPGDTTKSGLVIPTFSEAEVHYGIIVAFGKGYFKREGGYHPLEYKKGDIVVYGKGERKQYVYDSVICLIMKDEDIISIYEGNPELLNIKNQRSV
jgi:chaperonin GroES